MQEQVLARKTIGEYRYEVYYDNFERFDIDFETEEQKQAYIQRFRLGELSSYGVIKSKVCECCCLWSEVDSLWSMHFETAEAALEYYLTECEGVAI